MTGKADVVVLGILGLGAAGALWWANRQPQPETGQAMDPFLGGPGAGGGEGGVYAFNPATGQVSPWGPTMPPGSELPPVWNPSPDFEATLIEDARQANDQAVRAQTRASAFEAAAWTGAAVLGGGVALQRFAVGLRAAPATLRAFPAITPPPASLPAFPPIGQAAPAVSRTSALVTRAAPALRIAGPVAVAAPTAINAGQTVVALARGDRREAATQAGQTVRAGTATLSLGVVGITPRQQGQTDVRVLNRTFRVNPPNSPRQAWRNARRNVGL